jgi:hypothetical protein
MKKDCLDIGIIQAFLDGELASDLLENAANHLALCDDCALQMANAEEESSAVFSALDAEFNTLVPTQRLWAKINDEIEKEKKPFWQTVFAFLKNPAVSSFASLLIVFGVFMGYLSMKAVENPTDVARTNPKPQIITPISSTKTEILNEEVAGGNNSVSDISKPTEKPKNEFRVIKTVVKADNPKSKDEVRPKTVIEQYLPGEESYIKTIATLENTVNSNKDEILTPSARFTYEQNLALANDAIKKMRDQVKKNPRNESARQVLMASYQNKVDLLNSVAEKNQLMASMR